MRARTVHHIAIPVQSVGVLGGVALHSTPLVLWSAFWLAFSVAYFLTRPQE